jgi:hypothetical protein
LERENNHGNYEPGNVVWATVDIQLRNTRRNHYLTINGRTLCLQDWAKEGGIDPSVVGSRLRRGVPPEIAVSLPAARINRRVFKLYGK